MSFNTGRINTAPMNRAWVESDEIYVTLTLSAALDSFVSRGINVYDRQQLSAVYASHAQGARGFIETARMGAAALSLAAISKNQMASAGMHAAGAHAARLAKNIHIAEQMESGISMHSRMCIHLYVGEQMGAALAKLLRGAKNMHTGNVRMNAALLQQASTVLFAYTELLIDIPIPPGATLVVDAGGYAVLLDGESVIWAHSGDWPYFNRTTYDMTFTDADGALLGDAQLLRKVLYTERYL